MVVVVVVVVSGWWVVVAKRGEGEYKSLGLLLFEEDVARAVTLIEGIRHYLILRGRQVLFIL